MKRRAVVGAAILAAGLASCGSGAETPRNDLRSVVRRTAREARAFSYEERSGGRVVTVDGVVEDVFRYRVRLKVGEDEVLEEVAHDDALAVKLLPAAGPLIPQAPVPPGGWLLDATGATDLLFASAAGAEDAPGRDPVLDALTVLDHVGRALDRAVRVVVFNPESVDYRPQDDPFPRPGAGAVRYDLTRPDLPRANALGSPVPELRHFRKMSVFVRDGVVVSALEEIDVGGLAEELATNYGLKLPKDAEEARRAAPEALSAFLRAKGANPIRPRKMTASFREVGKRVAIELPAGIVPVSLRGFGTAVFGEPRAAAPALPLDASQLVVPGAATPRPVGAAPPAKQPRPPAGSVALGLLVTPVLAAAAGAWLWVRRPGVLRTSSS